MSRQRPWRPWPATAEHGTANAYGNQGCRCADCTEAWRVLYQNIRARRTPPPPGDPRHGTYSTYANFGCRCDQCRAAGRNARQARDARRSAEQTPAATS